MPALQEEGKYEFLTTRESVRDLFTAPFDVEFLGRWTTWVNLAYTGLVTGLILSGRDAAVEYQPFLARDAAFAASLSLNAGIGEEAVFRGWLLPLFHQRFGQRFWLANTTQAATFGALHPQAGAFAVVIATHLLTSFLFEVSPTDPLALGVVSLLFVGIVLLASWLPARRAARVDR